MVHHDPIRAQGQYCSGRHGSIRHDHRDFLVHRPKGGDHPFHDFDNSAWSVEDDRNGILLAGKRFYCMAKSEFETRYDWAYDCDYVGMKLRSYAVEMPGQLALYMTVNGPHGVTRTR